MRTVKDPRSDRARFMRAAPMNLCSSSKNHLTPGSGVAERTNRMTPAVEARKKISVRADSTIF